MKGVRSSTYTYVGASFASDSSAPIFLITFPVVHTHRTNLAPLLSPSHSRCMSYHPTSTKTDRPHIPRKPTSTAFSRIV